MIRKLRLFVWIMRAIVAAVLVVIVLFFAIGFILPLAHQEAPTPPSITEAPFIIQTASQFYYARNYAVTQKGGDTITSIRHYWTFDGKRYKLVDSTTDFPQSLYGPVNIIVRSNK